MGAAPIMWAAMASGVGPSVTRLPVDLPEHVDNSEVVEAQMEVFTGGITYEEYLDRQAALNARLVEEMPQAALQPNVVVELNQDDLNSLINPVSVTPLQIGVVKPVSPNVQIVGLNRAQGATQLDGGLVWALPIASPNAGAIRLHLENVSLPPNSELYFYSQDGQAFGPYTGMGPHGTGEFWTESIFGSEGILQLRVPRADNATLQQISFSLTELGHIGAQYTGQLQNTAANWPCGNPAIYTACAQDASCHSGAASSIWNAYAKMEWIAAAFIYTCTTGLLTDNNPTQDNFSLTANHCISSNNTAQNINFYWRFRTSGCNATCPTNSGWPYQTGGGATVSATGSGGAGDFTLLHLNNGPPSGSTLLGWTNVAVASTNGAALHRVSNPNFGPQVYSEQSVSTSAGTCNGLPRGPIIYSRDTLGGTDGGSSGSPVVNASNQVVGQLYGACGTNTGDPCDSVSNATIDGAFAYYWPSVCPFLDPANCGGGGCSPAGASCTSNSQCCSNSCKGKPGAKTCK